MFEKSIYRALRYLVLALSLSLALAVSAGCEGNGANSNSPSADAGKPAASFDPNEAVALKFGQVGAALSDDEFQSLIVAPVKKVYPNVSLELVRMTNESMGDLIAVNQFPDLYYTNASHLATDKELQIAADIVPLLKKNNIDTAKFDAPSIDFIKQASGDGKMYLLPVWPVADATFYNRDLFDKFGVSYPKDNMTWDDTLELGRKLSRSDAGVQYIGVTTGSIGNMKNGLVLPYVDMKSKKAVMDSESWKLAFETYDKMQKIPGNYSHGKNVVQLFENDRILALFPNFTGRVGEFEELAKAGKPLNFDLVSYPSFGNSPYAATTNVSGINFSVKSNKLDWAFRVALVLVSEENQLAAARNGRVPALANKDIQQQFGSNLLSFKGKHVAGFFIKPTNIPGESTKYDTFGTKRMNDAIKKVVDGTLDVNSALREANDLLNQDIAANP